VCRLTGVGDDQSRWRCARRRGASVRAVTGVPIKFLSTGEKYRRIRLRRFTPSGWPSAFLAWAICSR